MRLFVSGILWCLMVGAAAAADSGDAKVVGTLPGGATAWQHDVRSGERTMRLSGVSFEEKACRLRVIDNPPEARRSLPEVLAQTGAFAGSNGGYFHPDFQPIGLVVSNGELLHAFERAKLLSGVIAVRRNGRIELKRSAAFKMGPDVREALQAGPWLVEGGVAVDGLEATRPARRTVLATDGRGHWALMAISSTTLAEAADLLAREDIVPGWSVQAALNLDGGSSTALFARGAQGNLLAISAFGPVRNYLAISER